MSLPVDLKTVGEPGSPLCSYATHFHFSDITYQAWLHHCDCHMMQPTTWTTQPSATHATKCDTITSAHTQHYYRHLIILVIGLRCSTQALHFTAPFMPRMTLLGFMCPGLGEIIRSQALSHAINMPHDTSLFSHSLSPDQLPLLCTPFSFATYHTIYSACTTTSAPTLAFVLISPVYTDKRGQTEYTPPDISHFVPLPHTHTHTLPRARTLYHAHTSHHAHACTCTLPPPSLYYLFTPLALLSGCIQFDSTLFYSFSPIITNTPITLRTPACLLTSMLAPCLCSLALCAHT